MTTWFAMGTESSAESWRAIRTLRANPPDHVAQRLKGHRADVFHMALEQSQQQFAAAEKVGYESRPLNLFYGLSQAGRAIAAASARLGPPHDEPWRVWSPTSHGVDFSTTLSADGLLAQRIRVVPTSSDSYSRLVHALEGSHDMTSATFGSVLASVPEFYLQFRELTLGPVPLLPGGIEPMDMLFFPTRWEIEAPGLSLEGRTTTSAKAWLSNYPALTPLELQLDESGAPRRTNNPGYLALEIRGADQLIELGTERFPAGTVRYRNSEVILPQVGGSSSPVPPLARWWLLLFALSMLARYSPRDWAGVMDIRRSKIAPWVEFVLDTSLDAVPNLVAEALHSLNQND